MPLCKVPNAALRIRAGRPLDCASLAPTLIVTGNRPGSIRDTESIRPRASVGRRGVRGDRLVGAWSTARRGLLVIDREPGVESTRRMPRRRFLQGALLLTAGS